MHGHKSGLRIGDKVLQHIYQDTDGRCAIGTITGFDGGTDNPIQVTFEFEFEHGNDGKKFREYFHENDLTPLDEDKWT